MKVTLTLLLVLGACMGACDPGDVDVINSPPTVSILEPSDDAQLTYGQIVTFRAKISDDMDAAADLSLIWRSDVDGVIGTDPPYDTTDDDGDPVAYGVLITGRISPGTHQVSVSVVDTSAASALAERVLTVTRDDPPQATILWPQGDEVPHGSEVALQGVISDAEDPSAELFVAWYSSLDGLIDTTPGDGVVEVVTSSLSAGDHDITLTVTDSNGQTVVETAGLSLVHTEVCNGADDDGDGEVDEGFDADGNGLPDCYDEEVCDGLDNDGDGDVDEGYEDADGDGIMDCVDVEECDGVDNDGDGETDEFTDIDSDGDGLYDCVDVETCGDGVDNEGDLLIDCDDPDCVGAPSCP